MIVRLNCSVAFAFTLSVTCTVKVYVPAVVGVPLSNPDGRLMLNEVPGGTVPPVVDQLWYGVAPLVAEKV